MKSILSLAQQLGPPISTEDYSAAAVLTYAFGLDRPPLAAVETVQIASAFQRLRTGARARARNEQFQLDAATQVPQSNNTFGRKKGVYSAHYTLIVTASH